MNTNLKQLDAIFKRATKLKEGLKEELGYVPYDKASYDSPDNSYSHVDVNPTFYKRNYAPKNLKKFTLSLISTSTFKKSNDIDTLIYVFTGIPSKDTLFIKSNNSDINLYKVNRFTLYTDDSTNLTNISNSYRTTILYSNNNFNKICTAYFVNDVEEK